uniref:Uncharacterized protein n=1 Tax=Avena sativa TaxID=4498 RepID=A0ACD5Y485_AVESA
MPPPAATRRRGRAKKTPAFHVSVFHCMPSEPWEPWERDWAELPADAISCILHKLDLRELLVGGVAEVCRSWRRAAREEPELWRHIDVRFLPAVPQFTCRSTRANVMWSTLRLSAGQCHTFLAKNLDDDLFMFLAKLAPSLKSLYLSSCHQIIFNGGFAKGIKKLRLLEELTLVNCYPDEQVPDHVAETCRCLKHVRLVHETCHSYRIKQPTDDRKAFAIARMQGLRSLELVNDNLGNIGLTAIIDNCPHLERRTIQECRNISMDANLAAKCARIIMDYDEYFPSSGPCSSCSSPMSWFTNDDYDYDDYHDLSLYSYLGDEIDGADFEEHERLLDVKGMRRYLR